jgi:hypothetical protein
MSERPVPTLIPTLAALLVVALPAWAGPASAATDPTSAWQRAAQTEIRAFTEADADPAVLSAELRGAAAVFLGAAEGEGGDPNGYWRAARAEWLSGELLPLGDDQAKLERFERSKALAQRGIDANTECGECMMWKFSAMARIATTKGLFSAVRQAREMGELLDRGIELQPTHTDGPGSSTLGNLYYASANFNRVVPDSILAKWILGIRGDKRKGLAHSRKALELHPDRLDYRVEVGTQLLCLGTTSRRDERANLDEGRALLASVADLPGSNEDERREIHFANELLEDPKKACGYTGDKVVDMDAEQKKHERE